MDKETIEIITWVVTMLGYAMLWGSLLIGFLDWTYNIGFFRTTIAGLFLVGAGQYLRIKYQGR